MTIPEFNMTYQTTIMFMDMPEKGVKSLINWVNTGEFLPQDDDRRNSHL
jgi:hypothetical protein